MKVKIIETKDSKVLKSESYNFVFNKKTGMFARWGKTQDEDPIMGMPEIADIEITTSCSGPDGAPCKFCSPAGTKVNTPNGDIDIETNIKIGKCSKRETIYAIGSRLDEDEPMFLVRDDTLVDGMVILKYVPDCDEDEVSPDVPVETEKIRAK